MGQGPPSGKGSKAFRGTKSPALGRRGPGLSGVPIPTFGGRGPGSSVSGVKWSISYFRRVHRLRSVERDRRRQLKERTFQFAVSCRKFWKILPHSRPNFIDGSQFLRASASVGANYLEADNAVSRKDVVFRLRLCLKEARESEYWLRLLDLEDRPGLMCERDALLRECDELARILASIVWKLSCNR